MIEENSLRHQHDVNKRIIEIQKARVISKLRSALMLLETCHHMRLDGNAYKDLNEARSSFKLIHDAMRHNRLLKSVLEDTSLESY